MNPTYQYPYRPDDWQREIYPMPAFPVLAVRDAGASRTWYQDVLGFADVFTMRGPDGAALLVHLRWCKYGDVLLRPARVPAASPAGAGITLNFSAVEVNDLAARAVAAGASVVEGPLDRPWNTRDVTILDPDGYRLNFTSPLARALAGTRETFEAAMERVRDRLPTGSPQPPE